MTHMRFTPHPDDRANVEQIVDELAERRQAQGVSRSSMAAVVGVDGSSVWYLEHRRPANPLVKTLQLFGEALDARLCLDLSGLPELPADPAEAALLASGFLGTATISKLRRIREAAGIGRKAIQAAHGWSWSSLASLENVGREPYLSMLQRYARCLDGRITARWEELC